MQRSSRWRGMQVRKHQARATRKPKIRWEILGLQSLPVASLTTSMEDIRREVRLASLNPGNRSCVAERNANTASQGPDSSIKSRRGATESSESA